MVSAVQTFGELIHFHPHIHALVTDGVFSLDSEFMPLPKIPTKAFIEIFRAKVFSLLLAEGKIQPAVVEQMLTWRHSGFSLDRSVRITAEDKAGAERLIQYFVRCPFSQAPRHPTGQAHGERVGRGDGCVPGRLPRRSLESEGGSMTRRRSSRFPPPPT